MILVIFLSFQYNEQVNKKEAGMIYPSFLKQGSTIGIAAPSAGTGKKVDDYIRSVQYLESRGFHVKETPSVRVDNDRSADPVTRGKELNSIFLDPKVDMVMCAAGGDFLDEMIPFADFETMQKHPKWLMGASGPTGLLYPLTTKYDVATIYGLNGGSYSFRPVPDFAKNNLEILQGNLIEQTSWKTILSALPFGLDHVFYDKENTWQSDAETIHAEGRCIGGCIDVLKDLIGTRFDGTKDFLKKYKDDGIIWYFDNFSLSAEVFYRTLLQFRYAGWFDYTKAVIIGRTIFPSSETGMTYEEACELALGDYPYVTEADVGHTIPHMTLINGAMLTFDWENHEAKLKFSLK